MIIIYKLIFFLYCRKTKFQDVEVLITSAISIAASVLLGLLMPKKENTPSKLQTKDAPSSEYGFAVPLGIAGSHTYQGTLIWALPLEEVLEEVEPEGGNGGKGFSAPVQKEYMYYATCAYMLAYVGDYDENETNGVPFGEPYTLESLKINDTILSTNSPYIQFYNGSYNQTVDPTIQANEPNSPAYKGFCYIVFDRFPVKKYGNGFFAVTAVLRRGFATSPAIGIQRILKLAKVDETTSSTYYPDLAHIKTDFLTANYTFDGFKLASSGQKYKEAIDQLGYLYDALGNFTTVAQLRSSNITHQDLAQTHLTTIPNLDYPIGKNRNRGYTVIESNQYTLPYKLLGASEEGSYFSSYESVTTDVTEISNEVNIKYSDPNKDYQTTEISYSQDYHVVDYRKNQSSSISTDLACQANLARAIAENIIQKSYDTNRLFTINVAPSTYGNIQLGQRLIFENNANGDKTQILVTKITKGSNYTQEIQGFIYSDTLLPLSGEGYGYLDPNYTGTSTVPPEIDPDSSILANEFVVYDLPFTQTNALGKLGLWLAIDKADFQDGTTLNIWYKINASTWQNSGQTISARGKIATVGNTNTIYDHPEFISDNTIILNFNNPAWTINTISEVDFNKRNGNLMLLSSSEGTDNESFLFCVKDSTFNSPNYEISTYQIASHNEINLSPKISNTFNSTFKALVYGVGRQTWFSLPATAIGQTVQIACTSGDPSIASAKTITFEGKSYRAPIPKNRQAYRQINGDWLLSWSAIDIYDKPWLDASDITLDSAQFYTVRIYSSFASTIPLRVISSLTESILYDIADQTSDSTDSYFSWVWTIEASYSGYTTGKESNKILVQKSRLIV